MQLLSAVVGHCWDFNLGNYILAFKVGLGVELVIHIFFNTFSVAMHTRLIIKGRAVVSWVTPFAISSEVGNILVASHLRHIANEMILPADVRAHLAYWRKRRFVGSGCGWCMWAIYNAVSFTVIFIYMLIIVNLLLLVISSIG